ncbi:GFA family protein [Caballeronia sp. 15711]|jgi:hypothetical protein|uniref:GFA family protein n=1 Tax=Caballeronia sp. 15711 TaxID=3391029 RepID=UPI0039E50B27
MREGQCHCGSIKFEVSEEPLHSTLCYCVDCRRQSGAPVLAWAMCKKASIAVKGEASVYHSSETGRRSFCGTCGTGLFFSNQQLDQMGMIQVRIAAFNDPNLIAPKMQVQTAERPSWMTSITELPSFVRFPT